MASQSMQSDTLEDADCLVLAGDKSAYVDELVKAYSTTGKAVRWPIDPELEAAVKVSYRNEQATRLAGETAAEIARRYVYLSKVEMTRMVDLAERHVLRKPLHGVGIELGAGCGLLAAVVANRPAVSAVLGLEICETFDALIRKVATDVLGENESKVIPVIGSFDDLQLPDESLDFAIENDSLHHSDDLALTLKECARVLKPGGVLLCFDRCHPNSVTDEEVDKMLSRVYTGEFLVANCYPPDVVLTRRENGEHEYRLFEWQGAAEAAGLELTDRCDFHQRVTSKKAIKGLVSTLPKPLRRLVYKSENAKPHTTWKWLSQQLRKIGPHAPILAPRPTNVLVMTKA